MARKYAKSTNPCGATRLRSCPLVHQLAAAGWVLGCAMQLQQGQSVLAWTYAGAGSLALGLAMAVRRGPPGVTQRAGLGIPERGLACLGQHRHAGHACFKHRAWPRPWRGVMCWSKAFVTSLPQTTDRGQRLALHPHAGLGWHGCHPRPRHSTAPTDGPAALPIPAPPRPAPTHALTVRPGERWRWTVRLQRPHGSRNPHGFDAELWWWQQGVQATG